jgi:2-octaprenyl-6-methoxyphenol hydroxylase
VQKNLLHQAFFVLFEQATALMYALSHGDNNWENFVTRNTHEFDVLIIGGGLVGSSLACGLERLRLRSALLDPKPASASIAYDDRIIALAYGSRLFLEHIALWGQFPTTAIKHIHVSDRGHFGITRLHHAEMHMPALGYVSAARDIAQALQQQVLSHVSRINASALRVQAHPEHIHVDLSDGSVLKASLAVVADGGNSGLHQQVGALMREHEYHQTAIIAVVTPQRDHANIAYERFTDSGPLALLPMSQQRCSLVWTVRTETAAQMLTWSDQTFLCALQQRFGWRLGRFIHVGARQAYPLSLRYLPQPVQKRLVFIGNAAHTLHPVAGQGLNLGLRDAAALMAIFAAAPTHSTHDYGAAELLHAYWQIRKTDLDLSIRFTDSLVKLFSNDIIGLTQARNAGLLAINACPPLKHLLLRQTTGLAGMRY